MVQSSCRSLNLGRLAIVASCGLFVVSCGSTSPGLEVTKSADPQFVGAGSESTDPEVADPTNSDPETSDPETSDPQTSDPQTSDPETSDPGMMDLPGTDIPLDGPFPFDPNKPPQVFDGLMVATINDLIGWWSEEMPRVFGTEYPPLENGVFPAYPAKTDYPSPGCFDTYEEVAQNGYYCPRGDYIVWDDTNYAVPNYEDHGTGAITGLMSHEWGHAIQARTGVYDVTPPVPGIIFELQADCYSGAWFAHIARGESDTLSFSDADIRSGLIDTALSADPVGTTPEEDGAHGAGFDRVAAFQDGFELGVEQCSTYALTPPPITEIGFTEQELSEDDPGDLSYENLIESIPADLNVFWEATLPDAFAPLELSPFAGGTPDCGAVDMAANTNPLALFCPDNATVYLDEEGTRETLDQIGDFSPSYLIATAWAEAAQSAVGSSLQGEERVLYNDCFVGVWAGELPTEVDPDRVSLSAGDLDEAVATAILLGDDTAATDVRGDSFSKVFAFRVGVLRGIPGCNEEYG